MDSSRSARAGEGGVVTELEGVSLRGTPDSVKLITVVEVQCLRGAGTEDDVARIVVQYWDPETGELLAERDSWKEGR